MESRIWKTAGLAVAGAIAWGLFANADAQRLTAICTNAAPNTVALSFVPPRTSTDPGSRMSNWLREQCGTWYGSL